jgi:hypothetical protein
LAINIAFSCFNFATERTEIGEIGIHSRNAGFSLWLEMGDWPQRPYKLSRVLLKNEPESYPFLPESAMVMLKC